MTTAELQAVASSVLRLAEKQGHVVPRDIRGELRQAGLDEARWKEVVELLRESLHYRQGRYHFIVNSGSPRLEEEQQQQQRIRDVLERVLQRQFAELGSERRRAERLPFTRPVKIQTEDNQELTVLSQDLSPAGIRLIANRSLLGRKLRIILPWPDSVEPPVVLAVRILWTQAVADGLFENGGSFLEMISGAENQSSPKPTESP